MPDRRFLTADTRRILALAWPVVLTSLNWTILHVTDIVVVGLVSTEQVAALGASRTLTFILIVAALGAMSGVLVRSDEHTSELQSLMRNSYAVFCLKQNKQVHVVCDNNTTSKHNTRTQAPPRL